MNKYLGPAYLTLAASLWGGVYVVSKVVLDVLPALELIWLRYLLALVTLAVFAAVTGESWRLPRRPSMKSGRDVLRAPSFRANHEYLLVCHASAG